MPILDDIMDHDVIGPAIRQGRQEGISEGRQEGIHQGRREEVLKLFGGLIARRFGPLPASLDERLTKLSIAELEELSLRVLDARTIDELLNP